MSLKPKKQRFVDEYLVDLNATEAYRRAGYTSNSKAAEVGGCRLLKDPKVAAAVALAMEARAKRTHITQDQILQELALLGLSNLQHYIIDEYGQVRLADGVPAAAMRAVSSIKRKVYADENGNETVETEIKLWDKPGSLRMAGQHLGMFVERVKHSGDPDSPIRHAAAVQIYLPDNGRQQKKGDDNE
jgi:phage terminase small subunit